jgi:hypothetical protein
MCVVVVVVVVVERCGQVWAGVRRDNGSIGV